MKKPINYDDVGTIESNVAEAKAEATAGLDESLGLQPISIRLQQDLLDKLKALAMLNGIGYQPLIRQILTRWVDCEIKSILNEQVSRHEKTTKRTGTKRETKKAA